MRLESRLPSRFTREDPYQHVRRRPDENFLIECAVLVSDLDADRRVDFCLSATRRRSVVDRRLRKRLPPSKKNNDTRKLLRALLLR